jgi:tetratricopeptide (TPR) repeat protein
VPPSDFVTRGQALVSAGQYQEAVKVCRLGLLGRPTTVDGRVVLGRALLALKRYDEVLAEMRVALELEKTSIPAQALKGEALLRKGDADAALEVLAPLRPEGRDDPKLAQLLAEVDAAAGKGVAGGGGLGYVEGTKLYPNHGADEEDTGNDESTGGGFTKPTALAPPPKAPLTPKPTSAKQVALPAKPGPKLPSPKVLAVGDKSGTMEVDPSVEGIELDDDFGDIAAPPTRDPAKPLVAKSQLKKPIEKPIDEPRGAVVRSARAGGSPSKRRDLRDEVSTVELDDDEMIEVEGTGPIDARQDPRTVRGVGGTAVAPPGARPGGTAVRKAVNMPSGPIDISDGPSAPPGGQLARQQLVAALPTAAALPLPAPISVAPIPSLVSPASAAAAARPTLSVQPYVGPIPAAQPYVGPIPPAQPYVGPIPAAHHAEPIDPHLQLLMAPEPVPSVATPSGFSPEAPPVEGEKHRTGVRRTRSKLQIAVWVLIGVVVIGGGVFAGFQIRAMRLRKQIVAARDRAVAAAKSDTWTGWLGARDDLASIVSASPTADNKATLARARALLAFEFGDSADDVAPLVASIGPAEHGLDAELARAYLGLAQDDPRAARAGADAALERAPNSSDAQYVAGQAALISGDTKAAITSLEAAAAADPRPLHLVGLANALAANSQFDDALAANEKALADNPEHPAALIQRGFLLVAAGRVAPTNSAGSEIREKLDKIATEGTKPPADQARGVSPVQLAYAYLALAQVDFARKADAAMVLADARAMIDMRITEQPLGEAACETLLYIGQLAGARAGVQNATRLWPTSRRAQTTAAQLALVQEHPQEAMDVFAKSPDAALWPKGLAVRAETKAALGDADGARADFDAALKKQPNLELAIVGRAWLDLAAGDVEQARTLVEKHFDAQRQDPAMAAVWAAILRTDPAQRDSAREILERAVQGPPIDGYARAQLELARLDRDAGDLNGARDAYEAASRAGNSDARLESALLLIERGDVRGGHDSLELLLRQAPIPTSRLLLETARSRSLVGDHAGASQLLDQAEKLPETPKWQLDRERGRIMLRKGDASGAAQALARALDACGDDVETFLIAGDIIVGDATQAALLAKIKAALPRIKDRPEAAVVTGKLALATGDLAGAETAYSSARTGLDKTAERRRAQMHFGLAAIAYNKHDDPTAKNELDVAIEQDPSIYDAYLFRAEITSATDPKGALAEARKAVEWNPDSAQAWNQIGTLAHKIGDKKGLADAITRVNALAPGSDMLHELQALH